jgi:hypothetical protein
LRLAETEAIAAFLGMDVYEFVETYTELLDDRRDLTLVDGADGACVFLEGGNRCRIYPVRPRQCREFPNGWRFPGFREVPVDPVAGEACGAGNPGLSCTVAEGRELSRCAAETVGLTGSGPDSERSIP